MLRWMTSQAAVKAKAKAKKLKTKAKKAASSVRIRRSDISNNARLCRNILRLA